MSVERPDSKLKSPGFDSVGIGVQIEFSMFFDDFRATYSPSDGTSRTRSRVPVLYTGHVKDPNVSKGLIVSVFNSPLFRGYTDKLAYRPLSKQHSVSVQSIY